MARARSVELWNRQTPPWLVSIDSSFVLARAFSTNLKPAGAQAISESGNTELVVGDPLLDVGLFARYKARVKETDTNSVYVVVALHGLKSRRTRSLVAVVQ